MQSSRWPARALAPALLGALFAQAAVPAHAAPIELTYWSWNDDAKFVDSYNAAHPNVHIKFEKVPANDYDAKLLTATKAGTAPDVMLDQYQYIPTTVTGGALENIGPLGVDALKARYPAWVWNQVHLGDGTYAVPIDIGPVALAYRTDIFAKYHLDVPKTWADYAKVAEKLKAADPDVSISAFPTNNPEAFAALASQGGGRWFKAGADSWQVAVNDSGTKKVATYWQDLISRKLVLAEPVWSDAWYSQLQNGKLATWLAPAWGPAFLSSIASGTAGKWKIAPMPVWNAAQPVAANLGGSAIAVSTGSKHKKEAADFAIWFGSDLPGSIWPQADAGTNFPAQPGGVTASVLNRPFPFFNGQPVNQVYADAAKTVDGSWQWPPDLNKLMQSMSDGFGKVASGSSTLPAVLDATQGVVVGDLKAQGIAVK
jgi:multiple sugar transport system substrate-binding protein